ncbi:MAG: protein translocase subunit SecD [Actinomycetota bacterium]
MRRQVSYVVGIIVISIAGLVYTFVAGNEPLLGLDLQGGASVVLEPEPLPDGQEITEETLDQAVDIIRNRVDGLGVREPEVTRQGETILVQIPGVDDQQRAIDLVGQTAELRFRPVIGQAGFDDEAAFNAATAAIEAGELEGAALAEAQAIVDLWTLTPDALTSEPSVLQDRTDPTFQGRIRMGPVPLVLEPEVEGQRLTGEALESASARFNVQQGWSVAPIFKSGSPGIDDFNAVARACNTFQASCPAGRVAIEIDGFVESAPNVNAAFFERDEITISGDFTEEEAKDLALALNFGALPLELTPQESRIVSSTLGEDALDAGLIAGLIGLLLVSVYLIAYYRYLGVVAILSLLISGALLWTIIAWLGASQGLALTLAGVTGLIVSIGVSVDSNVVYFEHLKEDVRGGRTVRSAVERAFPIAYSTIVKADVASLIAAVVLYTLTVGQVRGFALFLGLATVLDLVATYFFMGPAIRILANLDIDLARRPGTYGIPKGIDTTPEPAAGGAS